MEENLNKETLNPKLETLNKSKTQNPKPYNLADRTLNFAKRVIYYVNNLPKTLSNIEIGKRLNDCFVFLVYNFEFV